MKYRCYGCMNEYQTDSWICPNCGYDQRTLPENALHMRPGSLLSNRYLIGKVLGFGGFGVTYLAWDHVLQQRVAIKEYLPSEFATRAAGKTEVTVFSANKAQQFADGMRKFVEEAKRLAKFQNEPGIVRIYDSFEANNTAYVIMEFLDGETLDDYLKRVGKVSVEQAIDMLSPVIKSLEAVHKAGVIHRDIAPDNIFLTHDGKVKLIDFGAARYATTSHSRSLTVIIKPGYSPEEQYRSRGEQGPHTDVYALAAVLYRMITGETPPDALERRAYLENKKKDTLIPPSKYCKVSKNQENAILNALNIYAESRTSTAEDFLNDLTSTAQIRRVKGTIKVLDLMKWPLWAKITVPTLGITAITALTLLVTGVVEFGGNPLQVFTLGGNSVRVPNVVNSSIGVAQEKLDESSLNPIISGREVSETVSANMVLRQGIDAGSVVEKGTEVDLYISAAPGIEVEPGLMPDLSYYTEAEAQSALDNLGAETHVEYEYSDDVAEGLVIRSSIGYGEPLPENEPVTLYVSKGPDPAAKEESSDDEANETVKLNRSSLSLFVGDSVSLSASGGDGSFNWSSSNPAVASVEKGTVTAVGKGSAIITVTSDGSSTDCTVTVQDYSISLSNTEINMFEGESQSLAVYGVPSGGSVSWNSSNSSVATVTGGTVTAVSNGNSTITAQVTINGRTFSNTCVVNVTSGGISLSKTNVELFPGGSETISATTTPSGRSVTWSSSDTSVATVSGGKITAVSTGTSIISARFSYAGKLYSANCTVYVDEVEFSLSTSNLTLYVGDSNVITANSNVNWDTISWSTSNSPITILSNYTDNSVTVNAVGIGNSTITATMSFRGNCYSASCGLTVMNSITSISSSRLFMKENDVQQLSIINAPAHSTITWETTNPSVATVSNNGTVTAIKEGYTRIRALITTPYVNYPITCDVSVSKRNSIFLYSNGHALITVNYSIQLEATTDPSGLEIQWSSSDPSIASVDQNGLVTGHAIGDVTITASIYNDGEYDSESCTISVVSEIT